MAKQTVESLIQGGKATAAPPLGPALGPTGVNIGEVVAEINKKTADMKGMQVPVKVTVDTDTKEFSIEIGTPPAAALIKKEAGVEKGASNPLTEKVADLLIEQVIKIAKIKEDALLGRDTKAKVREIVGTCQSMGILVEGKIAVKINPDVDAGMYDKVFDTEKTDVSDEKREELKVQLATFNKQFEGELAKIAAAKKAKADREEKKAAIAAKA